MVPEPSRTFSRWIGQRGPASQWAALVTLSVGLGALLLSIHAPAAGPSFPFVVPQPHPCC